jgi:hypothetical protein
VDGPNGGISAVRGPARSVVSGDDEGMSVAAPRHPDDLWRRKIFRDCSLLALNTAWRAFSAKGMGGEWGHEMNAQATKIQAAENNLKQLMADVTRAMEKAQEAVARIAANAAAAPAQTESTTSSR